MSRNGRRILLAVGPGILEGALTEILSADGTNEIVQLGYGDAGHDGTSFDAAVVCIELPDGIRADVIITLPDSFGSGGPGSVRDADGVHTMQIDGAERVIDLLDEFVPRHDHSRSSGPDPVAS